MDGLGPLLLLPGHLRPGLEDAVHVLHELQLLAPQVLLPDELAARPLVLLLLPLLLRPAPGDGAGGPLTVHARGRSGAASAREVG